VILTRVVVAISPSCVCVQFGITPLADNDPGDKYLYEITVATGMRKNAGTHSKVHYIVQYSARCLKQQ